ncbi:MAG: hypothetical protein ACJZ1Y_01905 [Candidatus Neomarinimicrobiota bacterium]
MGEESTLLTGLLLIKFYLICIKRKPASRRFAFRQNSPLKYWKLSAE